jgi:uncharacterized protein
MRAAFLGWVLASSILAVGVAGAQNVRSGKSPIIDVHMHAKLEDPRFGMPPFTLPLTGRTITASADAPAHLAECLAMMRRFNFVGAVADGVPHEAALRWRERVGANLLVGYGIDDVSLLDADFVRREHAAGRLHALAEIGAQYEGMAPNDPRMEPLYSLAEELDIPLGLHMHPGPSGAAYPPFEMTKMRAANGNPLLLEDVLVRHPKMRL